MNAAAGGHDLVSKGEYQLGDVILKSDVHLMIKKGTVIKPYPVAA